MSLEHILLGMLQQPASGYDLRSEFESGARFFWSAELSQIYPTLKRMEKRGWLESRLEPSPKGPDRRVYQRTLVGRDVLRDWLLSGPATGSERFAFIGQLVFMGELDDLEATLEFLMELREELSARRQALSKANRHVPCLAAPPESESYRTESTTELPSLRSATVLSEEHGTASAGPSEVARFSATRDAELLRDELPEIGLLDSPPPIVDDANACEREIQREAIERAFQNFGLGVSVVGSRATGPVVSQFELQLETGVRLSKINNLVDDIAISLKVPSVRIVAPMPGSNSVGIEVPHEHRREVRLRDVIQQSADLRRQEHYQIPLFLGQDVVGRPVVVDLVELPHLIVTGRGGSGKTACLDVILASILMTQRVDEVRIALVDPKMLEFSRYFDVPHLASPIATDAPSAEALLTWAVSEMDRRYRLLVRARARNLVAYNQAFKSDSSSSSQDRSDRSLPRVVVLVDELADMMATSGKDVEQKVVRLAQKGRAVGIHMVLATQKPSVDVITGLIKANVPARLSFQVASTTDSRVVLDESGAQKLLGGGDMLFRHPAKGMLIRAQATHVSDEELDRLVAVVGNGRQDFLHDAAAEAPKLRFHDSPTTRCHDELYDAAVRVVVREGRGSVSLIQRSLKVGYGRAARLIDEMAEDGVVGPYNGAQAREVLVTLEEWSARRDFTDTAHGTPHRAPQNIGQNATMTLADADVDLATFHRCLGVQMGIMSLTTKVEWCDQAIATVLARLKRT